MEGLRIAIAWEWERRYVGRAGRHSYPYPGLAVSALAVGGSALLVCLSAEPEQWAEVLVACYSLHLVFTSARLGCGVVGEARDWPSMLTPFHMLVAKLAVCLAPLLGELCLLGLVVELADLRPAPALVTWVALVVYGCTTGVGEALDGARPYKAWRQTLKTLCFTLLVVSLAIFPSSYDLWQRHAPPELVHLGFVVALQLSFLVLVTAQFGAIAPRLYRLLQHLEDDAQLMPGIPATGESVNLLDVILTLPAWKGPPELCALPEDEAMPLFLIMLVCLSVAVVHVVWAYSLEKPWPGLTSPGAAVL
ncbi:MAG TPA: hypothetical protein VGO93_03460 [Candidatus Xenobia bacterium]